MDKKKLKELGVGNDNGGVIAPVTPLPTQQTPKQTAPGSNTLVKGYSGNPVDGTKKVESGTPNQDQYYADPVNTAPVDNQPNAQPDTQPNTPNATNPNDMAYLLGLPGLSDGTKQALGNLINTGYKPSQTVTDALNELNRIISQQPAQFQSQYFDQLNGIMNRILGRESFSYDLASDPMYQQYRDQYMQSGRQAMEDTMGQAAAMTGGYGSSYATTAGNQAYQQHLTQLNQMAPELYQMALQQYQMTGDQLQQQYGLLNDMYQAEYGQYQDQYDRWLAERDFAQGRYSDERSFGYNDYRDRMADWKDIANWENSQYNTDRSFDYQKQIDERNYNYQREMDEYQKQIDERNYNYQKQIDERNYAYDYALRMIELGKKPSKELMDQLGLSEADIEKLRKYYKNKNNPGSGGSGGSSGGGNSAKKNAAPDANLPKPNDMLDYADYIELMKKKFRSPGSRTPELK